MSPAVPPSHQDPRICRTPFAEFDHLSLKEVAKRDWLRAKLATDGTLAFHEAFLLGDLNRRSHPPIYDDPGPPESVA